MRAISAADAISPAIQRTRDFLFRPFHWGTFLKLSLVALITEGLGGNFNSANHGGSSTGHGPTINSPFDIPPVWIAAIVASLLLAMVVAILVFYLITRLRFAFFHCLVNNTREIAPGWKLYARQATRFFVLNLVVGFCFLLLMALISIPFVAGFVRLFHEMKSVNHLDIPLAISLVLPLIPIFLLLILAGVATDLILRDFMLPHYALENATAGRAWAAVKERIRAEKVQFFVYGLLRVILPTIATVGLFIVLLVPTLVLAGSVAMVEVGLHSAFADATGAASIAGICIQVLVGVVAFGFALLVSVCLGGPLSTGTREYALMFYGGRYSALGDKLFPLTPGAAQATAL